MREGFNKIFEFLQIQKMSDAIKYSNLNTNTYIAKALIQMLIQTDVMKIRFRHVIKEI